MRPLVLLPSVLLLVASACKGSDAGGLPPVPADLDASGVQTCTRAAERDASGPWDRKIVPVEAPTDYWTWAGGVVVADFDEDAFLDAVAPVETRLLYYPGAPGGLLAPITDPFEEVDASFASGGSAADYDGDGDLDLYVTRVVGFPAPEGGEYGRNRLLRNDDGVFVDVTDEAGVDACGVHHRTLETSCFRSMASSWGDVDGDGDLDLYVGNYGFADESGERDQSEFDPAEPDFLYLNRGDGTFEDASDWIPPEVHDGYTYAGGFHDLDGDLDLDLYVVNDFGNCWPNRVMWNEGGRLVWRGEAAQDRCPGNAGADPSYLELSMTGMALAVGDLNDDGWLDLAIPEWKTNSLLVSDGQGHWAESADLRGFVRNAERGQDVGWGTEAGDLDNDGDLDLVSQYGFLASENPRWDNAREQPDAIYVNEPDGLGGWRFVDRGLELGVVDPEMERGVALADLNRDGWLDLAKRNLVGPDAFYVSRCGTEAWLVVDLAQPGTPNTRAVGARIEIHAGDERWLRHIVAGGTGYASAGPPEAHFGFGHVDRVDLVRVIWPDGRRSELRDVDTRQRITITRR